MSLRIGGESLPLRGRFPRSAIASSAGAPIPTTCPRRRSLRRKAGGIIVKREWLRFYDPSELPEKFDFTMPQLQAPARQPNDEKACSVPHQDRLRDLDA